jgi:hypothetical protein
MSTKKEIQIPEEIHCNLRLSSSARKTVGEVRERNMSNTTKAVQWITEDYSKIRLRVMNLPTDKPLTEKDIHKCLYGDA